MQESINYGMISAARRCSVAGATIVRDAGMFYKIYLVCINIYRIFMAVRIQRRQQFRQQSSTNSAPPSRQNSSYGILPYGV